MSYNAMYTAQKIKFSIKDFFGKCDQIRKNWPDFHFVETRQLMGSLVSIGLMTFTNITPAINTTPKSVLY